MVNLIAKSYFSVNLKVSKLEVNQKIKIENFSREMKMVKRVEFERVKICRKKKRIKIVKFSREIKMDKKSNHEF